MLLSFIGRKILTERSMTVLSLAEINRKRSSTSLLEISSDAKYLHVVRIATPHHITTYIQGNIFPQSNQSIHVAEPPPECPLIATTIIDVDKGKSVTIKDSTDISGLFTISGKEPLTFNTLGVNPP